MAFGTFGTRMMRWTRHAGLAALLGALLPAASAGAAELELPGKFAVDTSGAATYSVPIEVPPGTMGIAPALSLNYSSAGGDGIMGVGWSLKSPEQYLRKAQEFARNLRGAATKDVEGETPNVARYTKNGRYVDLTPDKKIISFGSTGGSRQDNKRRFK